MEAQTTPIPINVPIVKCEIAFLKNLRMISFTVITIIIILIIMNHIFEAHTSIYIPTPINMESFESDCINKNIANVAIPIKSIILYNLNKKIIPVFQIIYITDNDSIHYIPVEYAKISNTYKGINMQFNLPKETKLKQIIIDIDEFSIWKPNITTTQVEARNNDNVVVWNNCEPLYSDQRYINLYIVKYNIIYPAKSQKLCTGLSSGNDSNQENILNSTLHINSWDSGMAPDAPDITELI
jgi:hypothetical protein